MVKLGSLLEESISKKSIFPDDMVTFVGMQDVSEDAILNTQHVMKYTDIKRGLTYFEKDDVLVAKITPCFENGKGAYLNILGTDVGFGSTEFHVLRANENAEPAYIYQHTKTKVFRSKLEMDMVGTAGHRRVPLSALQEYLLPVKHSRQEQKVIAQALSDVDELIVLLKDLIAKKRDIKTATMQQLITGKKRLAGFDGEWKTTTLGKIGSFRKGSGVKKDQVKEYGFPCIRYGEIYTKHNDYIKKFYSFINSEVASEATLIKYGDLLFSGSGETAEEIGKCVAYVDDIEAYAGGM